MDAGRRGAPGRARQLAGRPDGSAEQEREREPHGREVAAGRGALVRVEGVVQVRGPDLVEQDLPGIPPEHEPGQAQQDEGQAGGDPADDDLDDEFVRHGGDHRGDQRDDPFGSRYGGQLVEEAAGGPRGEGVHAAPPWGVSPGSSPGPAARVSSWTSARAWRAATTPSPVIR